MFRRTAITFVVCAAGLPWLVAAAPTKAGPIVPPPNQLPEVGVTPPTTGFGATVRANLNGWRVPLVIVSICGDEGRRGSQDCNQPGSVGVLMSSVGEGSALLTARPPLGCPCLIRASTPDNAIVRTAPIDIDGVPVLRPDQLFPRLGAWARADQLHVEAHLVDQSSLLSWFGASGSRRLRLTLHNLGSTPLSGLSLSAAVGRTLPGDRTISLPDVPLVPAQGTVTVFAPVDLGIPTYGSYVMTGRVDGLSRAVAFALRTDNTPWGLVLVGVIGGVLLTLLAARHRRSPVTTRGTTDDVEANTAPTTSPPPDPDTTLTGSELQEQLR